jgi:hypothetical protein
VQTAILKLRAFSQLRLVLTVHDVFCKLAHYFAGLEGKRLGNRPRRDYRVFKAVQMIDCALSRTDEGILSCSGLLALVNRRDGAWLNGYSHSFYLPLTFHISGDTSINQPD